MPQRRSKAAVRPARQRLTVVGRAHDGSLAILRDNSVLCNAPGGIDAVEHCSQRLAGDASSKRSIRQSPGRVCH